MPCDHCPRKGVGCRGAVNPRLCELVDPTRPGRDLRYIPLLADPDASTITEEQRASVRANLAALKAAERCPYRSPCHACGMIRCAAAGGSLRPVRDCISCIQTYGLG